MDKENRTWIKHDVEPTFDTHLDPVTLAEGDRLVLRCSVSGLPDPEVTWAFNNQYIQSDERTVLKNRSGLCSLTISDVMFADRGQYTCRAVNQAGETETTAEVTIKSNTKVSKSPAMDLPRFLQHPQGCSLVDGDPAVIECSVQGNVEISWYKGCEKIRESDDFRSESDGNRHRLVIAEVFPEDSGTYKVEVSNSTGTTSSQFTVLVEVPEEELSGPVFVEFPKSQAVEEGAPVTFACSLDNVDTVTWMTGGRTLDGSGRFKIKQDNKRCTFTIPAAIVTDAGTYTVEANNSRGNSTWTFTLSVNVSASPCADIDVLSLIRSVQ